MAKQILCNWRECRSVDAAARETLRRSIDPGAVAEAVGAFFLEKSGVASSTLFPDGIPPRRLSGWELSCTGLPESKEWRCVNYRCLLAGVDGNDETLRRAVAAFTAALPAFWVVGPGTEPLVFSSLLPMAEPTFAAATRAGQKVWRTEIPLCAAILAVPGVTVR